MTTGFQIYHFDSRYDQGFVDARLHNWFSTFEEALERKHELEKSWSKYGVQYIIVQCAGRDFEKIEAGFLDSISEQYKPLAAGKSR